MAKIYVASSWRNKYQPEMVAALWKTGRSAHTEAGWFAGRGLKTIVYMPGKQEPELMYKLLTEWWATLMNWLTPCVKSRIAVLSRSRE